MRFAWVRFRGRRSAGSPGPSAARSISSTGRKADADGAGVGRPRVLGLRRSTASTAEKDGSCARRIRPPRRTFYCLQAAWEHMGARCSTRRFVRTSWPCWVGGSWNGNVMRGIFSKPAAYISLWAAEPCPSTASNAKLAARQTPCQIKRFQEKWVPRSHSNQVKQIAFRLMRLEKRAKQNPNNGSKDCRRQEKQCAANLCARCAGPRAGLRSTADCNESRYLPAI